MVIFIIMYRNIISNLLYSLRHNGDFLLFLLNCTNYNTNTYINCPDNNSPFIKSYKTQDKIMLLEKGMTPLCDCDYK